MAECRLTDGLATVLQVISLVIQALLNVRVVKGYTRDATQITGEHA